jgi:hypothetical protein
MSRTNGSAAETVNRNLRGLSFDEEKRRDSLLRAAWNCIVAGFPCRPSPRGPWDETATGDQTPWKYVITPIRSALAAAVASGDQNLIEQTLEGARAFCRELEADFASIVPAESEESIMALALEETQRQGSADPIEMALAANPTRTEAERAIGPLAKHSAALAELVNRCRRLAREPQTLDQQRAAFYTPRSTALFKAAP